jgi:hypothetical protein
MQNRRNYYRILHVQPDAPAEVIRASHRTLMLRLRRHPDLGGDHWNATLLNEAFSTLMDPERRAEYDAALGRPLERQRHPPNVPVVDPAPGAVTAPKTFAAPPRCALCGAPHVPREAHLNAAMCSVCDSPLCLVVKHPPDGPARRAMARLPREMPLVFCLAWPHRKFFAGVSTDVSINGIQFVSVLELIPGERVRVDSTICSGVGIVRHCRREPDSQPPMWRSGVEFLTLRVREERGLLISRQT